MNCEAKREGNCWELGPDDDAFPLALHDLETVPEVLYGKGDPAVLQGPCLSIIGARRATPYGIAVAEMAGRVAAESGVVVVSGGAMGCDCAAGRAALGQVARRSSSPDVAPTWSTPQAQQTSMPVRWQREAQ